MAKKKKKLKKGVKILYAIGIIIVIGLISTTVISKYHDKKNDVEYGKIEDPKKQVEVTLDVDGGTSSETNKSPTQTTKLLYEILDVGQGSSTFIDYGDYEILIDAGYPEYGKTVCKQIKDKVDGKLDLCICTHSDADHLGGFTEVFKQFDVETVIYGNSDEKSKSYKIFEDGAKKEKCVFEKKSNKTITIGDNIALTIFDIADNTEDVNDESVVTLLQDKECYFLNTGDLTAKYEDALRGKVPHDIDVVTAGHHGSKTSNSLLGQDEDDIVPKYFVISCAKDNEYNFPNKSVIEKAEDCGSTIFTTYKKGNIKFTCNGEEVQINN